MTYFFYACKLSNLNLIGPSGLLISNETESRESPHHVNRRFLQIWKEFIELLYDCAYICYEEWYIILKAYTRSKITCKFCSANRLAMHDRGP